MTYDLGPIRGDYAVAAATIFAALLAALLTWWINYSTDRRRVANERESQTLKALEFLTGGTQKRSAGIGLLEGLFKETGAKNPLRPIFLPVVRNQLIYLATSSDPKRELHEHDNFFRLAEIWLHLKPNELECGPLRDALKLRDSGSGGLEFSEPPYTDRFRTFCDTVGLSVSPNTNKSKSRK